MTLCDRIREIDKEIQELRYEKVRIRNKLFIRDYNKAHGWKEALQK